MPGPAQIRELAPGSTVSGVYLLSKADLGTTKNGQPYGALTLEDRTGRVEEYRGQVQMVLTNLAADASGAKAADFLPASPFDPDKMWREFKKLKSRVAEPNLKKLLEVIFGDRELAASFKVSPAAKGFHHAYVHGLLEHTLSVAGLAVMVAGHYPHLDGDLLLAGAILHDIGKTRELTLGPPLDYTDQGRLLGHLVLGLNILDAKLGTVKSFPAPLADHLRHLVVSHHGLREFGSPEVPRTPEALALHMLDDLDAKTAGVKGFLDAQPPGNGPWTGFNRMLERQFYTGFMEPGQAGDPAPAPDEPEAAAPDRPPGLFDAPLAGDKG